MLAFLVADYHFQRAILFNDVDALHVNFREGLLLASSGERHYDDRDKHDREGKRIYFQDADLAKYFIIHIVIILLILR